MRAIPSWLIGCAVAVAAVVPLVFSFPYWGGPVVCSDGQLEITSRPDTVHGDPAEPKGTSYNVFCVTGDARVDVDAPAGFAVAFVTLAFGTIAFAIVAWRRWSAAR